MKTVVFVILMFVAAGCSTPRTASIGWEDESVRIIMSPPGGSTFFTLPAITCLTCNDALPTVGAGFDEAGVLKFKFGEINERITHRFRLDAAGIDTALILKTPEPREAVKRYGLSQELIGRVIATEYVIIYRDTTMQGIVSHMERQDEANIFFEDDMFYHIHHPHFREPVVILKSSAIRLY